MAFSTQPGSGASDITSYVGTTGEDSIVFEGNTENFFLGANADNDFIAFDNVVALTTGTYTNGEVKGGAGDDTFTDLSGFGINLVGTWLNGNSGDDLIGGGGAINAFTSTIQGGAGEDTLTIGNGTGTIFNGNKDDDTLDVQGVVNQSTIGGGQGDDTITTFFGTVTNTSFLLGKGDDTFTDGAGALGAGNTVDGGEGADFIDVQFAFSAVTVTAGAGVDTIIATANDDNINGGLGNDSIDGNFGADTMTGGGGANTYIYLAAGESFAGAIGDGDTDIITDFTTGADTFDAVAAGFTPGTVGKDATAAASYITYGGALTAANTALGVAGAGDFVVAAVGTAGSFTAFLFGNSTGAPAVADFAVQIGVTGSFATAAQATASVNITDFV